MRITLAIILFAILVPSAYADQGSFNNSGGSTQVGSDIFVTSSVAVPAGTMSLDCPVVTTGSCAGGTFTFAANDGTSRVDATFTSGTYAESCSGGGKGGHINCSYNFSGYISGTWTVNGVVQAIVGITSQAFKTGGAAANGKTAFNSAYSPFYYSDSQQIHRSDDLQGTNQVSFGSQGGGMGQFYGAYGIALDSAGRIYVADTYNCRVVRIDDMNGTNWTSYGAACGSGPGQFYDPSGIAVDAGGKIYVMDTGNSRVVRLDNINGDNWVSYGTMGSGAGQFSQYLTSVAVDASGQIYVADTGNLRVVRIDDMNGANWTALTQSQPVNGVVYTLQSPVAVALDSTGRIYVADNEYYAPGVIRVDDMTGTNWTSIYTSPSGSTGLNSISVDSSGTVFAGGGGVRLVDDMAGVLTSSGTIGPLGPYYVFGVTPVRVPVPRPPAIRLSPPSLSFTQNVGGVSAPQPVTISNFGSGPLDFWSISANSVFPETNNCPNALAAGSSCTVNVSFAPTMIGPATGLMTVNDDSGNLGSIQTVSLSGLGTGAIVHLSPSSLTFAAQAVNSTSAPKSVVVQNVGTGPLQVNSITATAPFSQTNNCSASIPPGGSCTVQVSFTPTAMGTASGTLTIVDNAGTQTVGLTGTGSAPITLSPTDLSFGTVAVGRTSLPRTVTLTNHQSTSVSFSSIATSADFALSSNTCGTSVAAGTTCKVGVTFSPTVSGAATGTLKFTDNAVNSPQTVNLTGTGR